MDWSDVAQNLLVSVVASVVATLGTLWVTRRGIREAAQADRATRVGTEVENRRAALLALAGELRLNWAQACEPDLTTEPLPLVYPTFPRDALAAVLPHVHALPNDERNAIQRVNLRMQQYNTLAAAVNQAALQPAGSRTMEIMMGQEHLKRIVEDLRSLLIDTAEGIGRFVASRP